MFHFPPHYLSLNPTLQFFMFPLFRPVLHFCLHLLLTLRPPPLSSRPPVFPLSLSCAPSLSRIAPPSRLYPHPHPTAAPPFNSAHCPSSPFHLRSCAPSSARKMPSSISRPFTPTPPRCRHAQAHFAESCVFILHTDANLRLKLPWGEHTLTLIQSSCQLLKA